MLVKIILFRFAQNLEQFQERFDGRNINNSLLFWGKFGLQEVDHLIFGLNGYLHRLDGFF